MCEDRQSRRRRDPAATRTALLRAAGELFAERGFDQTTVREVASRAEVNQALLFRYFGSKQELFAEVLSHNSEALLDGGEPEELPRRILESVLSEHVGSGTEHTLVALLRSFSDERAARLLRDELGGAYAERLARFTDASDAELRADLVLAWFFGVGMMRSVLRKSPLAEAPTEVVVDHLMRAVSLLLEKNSPSEGDEG
ncbi:TetR/AcrR family transcriptional regulator [Actinopolyspora erythraea]|uniref:TetR family transcriptional regulator n=1 Tax=Actinopolyspora erythraea TaxID=414996 RepID=A0A099D278_9ACTN|nr:TetR family transcriptional regulator [Actinopolyspora erythraea]ASU77929.1 TetR/AcrR family transcriptional regulator [Actinopolyspora erythraea]KGI79912.1 TetR family transcriptional regulator [Actinopolyspora erythraea]